ncbi:MAG: HD domain-containing protein [Syntrophaceticus schinkii]
MIRLEDVQHNPDVEVLMKKVHEYLATMLAITHDEEHAHHVANLSYRILKILDYPEREAELAAIAGYMHDIGNVVNRYEHGRSGALMAFHLLMRMGMPAEEIAVVIAAIGNHEERSGFAVSNVAAAVILADKSNVHYTRVRKEDEATFTTRDRVNYAARNLFLPLTQRSGRSL